MKINIIYYVKMWLWNVHYNLVDTRQFMLCSMLVGWLADYRASCNADAV